MYFETYEYIYIPQKQTFWPNQHWWTTGTILSFLFVCLNKQSLAIILAASDWFYWSVSSIAGLYLLIKWTIIVSSVSSAEAIWGNMC